MKISACNWQGNSGTTYSFDIYSMFGDWNDVPGNYIFAKETSTGHWSALYTGEAGSFKTRLTPSHEEWDWAVKLGATHVHARVNHSGKSARLAVEKDLILSLRPPLNQKGKPRLHPSFS